MKITLFKNSFSDKPERALTFAEFIDLTKQGEWKRIVMNLRAKRENETTYKRAKASLPAVTVSGEFKTRDKYTELDKRLTKHSGLICIDVDKKDNLKMRTKDLVDKDCLAQWVSCGGEGIKIVYRCKPVKTAEEHRRIYDAIAQRMEKKGVNLKLDPIVKSIANLQYVSFDPELYYNPKTKLVVNPLPPIKVPKRKKTESITKDIEQLNEYIEAVGEDNVTKDYEDWLLIMFGLSYSLGEHGREAMHKICKTYPDYSALECDEKYDGCLEANRENISKPVTLSTVYQILIDAIPKPQLKRLAKKYNKGHAVGVGEDVEHGDLAGMVRFKLFLFKKAYDKKTNTITELTPWTLNLNAFEALLKEQGFFRFGTKYVHIVENIVEEVDLDDVLRIITRHIEGQGDYDFVYAKVEYHYGWEEIVHLWREKRAMSTTYNQIAASLEHWQPNLLKDSADTSFVPYRNGVVVVTNKGIDLKPYKTLKQQIWKERILPRDYKHTDKRGMFEDFFANVMGRGKTVELKRKSEHYRRALWYFGYMLHGSKRQSTARAWLLYDIKTGNNGRSGKTIIGNAIGKVRSVITIDGKQVDFRNRFAFQTVQPWTDVVFIDDPSKFMSLIPLFNMISGDINADRKNQNPIVKAVKFMIASNWILEAEGESEVGRQFVTQLDDYYIRYAKEHKNTITPIVDAHGKEFFTDWDDKDWSKFDTFCMKALKYHLASDSAPSNIILGNSNLVRFIQLHEEELFFELATAFILNVKPLKNDAGGLIVPQQVLTNIIKDHNTDLKATKAGKLAREFLHAIGGGRIELTSMSGGGRIQMAYKLLLGYASLSFGPYAQSLPRPKF